MKQNIILIGFMGTGKTTVGQILAKNLGWAQIDCDQWIEEQAKMTIPEIFAQYGEEKFRELETNALQTILTGACQIVTTGGGAVLRPVNRGLMLGHGLVVALSADKETIFERVRHDQNRPLLAGDAKERIAHLLEQRKGLYEFAPVQINTNGKGAEEVAAEIEMSMRDMGWK